MVPHEIHIINSDGHDPKLPFVIVDRFGMHVDLSKVYGQLFDAPTVAEITWGNRTPDGRVFGVERWLFPGVPEEFVFVGLDSDDPKREITVHGVKVRWPIRRPPPENVMVHEARQSRDSWRSRRQDPDSTESYADE